MQRRYMDMGFIRKDGKVIHRFLIKPISVDFIYNENESRKALATEVIEWCRENFGPNAISSRSIWGRWHYNASNDIIHIHTDVDAVAFKLRWC